MYIVTFTAHQQRNMVRPPNFFGAGDATDRNPLPISWDTNKYQL